MQFAPYVYDQPIDGSELFVGRISQVEDMTRRICHGHSFAVLGGTRMGKTSILLQIKNALGGMSQATIGRVVGPIFLSTHQFGKLTRSSIYAEILEEMCLFVAESAQGTLRDAIEALRSGSVDQDSAYDHFYRTTRVVLREDEDFQLFIMLDEIDELKGFEWSHVFFTNLRHLIGESHVRDRVNTMVSGTLSAEDLWNTAGSPFHNMVTVSELHLVPDDELRKLIPNGFDGGLPPGIETDLLAEVGGHPYLAQFFLSKIWEHLREAGGSPENLDIGRIGRGFLKERRGDFPRWWSACSVDARRVFVEMAQAGEAFRRAQVIESCDYDVDVAVEVLDHLLVNGLVREIERNRYEIGSQLFARWALERARTNRPSPVTVDTDEIEATTAQRGDGTDVWRDIEQVELTMRQLIRSRYAGRWGDSLGVRIHQVLGDQVFADLLAARAASERRYPYSEPEREVDLLDFCYIGQLEQLIRASMAWDMFKDMFSNKRQLRTWFEAIHPVRNDRAHFRTVPRREADRCRVACGDLLSILRKAGVSVGR